MKPLLTVDELASYIHKSVASIRSDVTRNPASLPPICRLPGTKRLLWRVEDVEFWISQHIQGEQAYQSSRPHDTDPKPRRGRPKKAQQVARQRKRPLEKPSESAGAE